MYDAVNDPYCYPGSTVLRNIPGLVDQSALDAFEAVSTTQRADEPLPYGRLSVRHYRAIHRHLFQDIYRWAGQFRTVRLSKESSAFCYPEHIAAEMQALFAGLRANQYLRDRTSADFATEAARFLSTLNAIHPFREGNGRTQLTFLLMLADGAGHPVELEKLDPSAFLNAMIDSFFGNEEPLIAQLRRLTGR